MSTMAGPDTSDVAAPPDGRLPSLAIAAVASLSAGAIHAAAIGAHADHPGAARTFTWVALFQIAWGAGALVRRGRLMAVIGAFGNAALVGGWVLAKTRGISFVSGLDEVEPIQFADGICAALATVSALAAARSALVGDTIRLRPAAERGRPAFAAAAVVVLAAVSLPGMVEAGRHAHSHGPGTSVVVVNGKAKVVTVAAAVPTKPYDPKKPIDLGGVKGVSEAEQARAENVVAETVIRLPQWASTATAEKAGYKSIGDGMTGFEHYINWGYINDDKTLDPDFPESLVYRIDGAKKTLVSAMFMLKPGSNLDTVPDLGGALTQWHIHDDLCFTDSKVAPHVAGLTSDGTCRPPLVKLKPVPMIHVWIVPNRCGPFAALEGIAAGQVKAGEEQACDHVHGASGGL
jgi:hypothetical protein